MRARAGYGRRASAEPTVETVPHALQADLGIAASGGRQRWLQGDVDALLQPALAYLLARLLGLEGTLLLAAVVMSGLPTAQNVFVFATRFQRATALARDAVVLSTLLAAATLVAVSLWLG